jgi:peptidoglycan/LPS O-acetylase OafA/YrhL
VDGLRGLAVFMVVWHHLTWRSFPPGWGAPEVGGLPVPLFAFLSNGWTGVNLFFFLSGLVLFLPYAEGRRTFGRWSDVEAFYRRRARRLLPLFFLSALVCAVLFDTPTSQGFVRRCLLLLTVTFGFTTDQFFPSANWVLWSLGVEIWFSLLFPAVVIAWQRFGARVVVLGAVLVSLGFQLAGSLASSASVGNTYLNPLKDSLPGRLDDFCLGMAACSLVLRPTVGRNPWAFLGLYGGLLVCWFGCASWDLVALGSLRPSFIPLNHLLLDVGFLVILGALLRAGPSAVGFLLSNPISRVAGRMSFSIYVWHGVVKARTVPEIYGAADLALYVLLLGALSLLSFRFVEFGHDSRGLRQLLRGGQEKEPCRASSP